MYVFMAAAPELFGPLKTKIALYYL